MRNSIILLLFTCSFSLFLPLQAQEIPAYTEVQNTLKSGWNTWSTYSMASHVLLPYGATLNLGLHKRSKNTDGYVNRFFLDKKANGWKKPILKPGYHSYSGDYTELEITYRKVTLRVQTAAEGKDFYMLITPIEKDPEFSLVTVLEGGLLWNRPGKVSRTEDHLVFELPDTTMRFHATTEPLDDPFFNSLSPFIALNLDQTIGLSNQQADLGTIQQKINAKREAYLQHIAQYGELSEVYAGMSSCLAWNTVYDALKDRVFSTVDRSWNVNRGGYVFFGWDNFFMAHMIAMDAPHLGMANAVEALNEVTEEGFVSNHSQGNGRKAWDRSQPPVGGMVCWEIYQKHPKKWFLEAVYPRLLRWNEWWLEKRLQGNLLAWGSHLSKNPYHDSRYNTLKAAMLETGIDDSPMYEGASFDQPKGIMKFHDVGLNAMYIGDCEALMKMAEVLGKKADAKRLKARMKQYQQEIQTLWNEENSLFQNYDLVKESFSERISPTSFYPMIAKTATPDQAKRMIEAHMLNEAEFWGEWILPSISKNDPLYPKQKYWKGAIWAPMNFLVYLGLRNYGFTDTQTQFVDKSVALFKRNWLEKGFVCENYSPIDGTCTHERLQSSSWYTWGGMMAIIGLMEAGYY